MTTRRIVLLGALVLALAAAVAWWRWPRGGEAPARKAEAPAVRDAPGAPRAPADDAPVPEAPSKPTGPIALSPATVVAAPDAPAGELAGRVLNWGNGAPVPGAEVTLAAADGGASSFVTDAGGRFVAKAASPGRHRVVSAFAAGFLPWAPDPDRSPLEVVSRPNVRIDGVVLYLVPALTYHGRVVDPDGAPVVGATVVILDAATGERAAAPIDDTFTSGADGRFDFHGPDDALLEARFAGYAPGRARLDGAAQTSHELTIVLGARGGVVPVKHTISGRVLDGDGKGVEGARVIASPEQDLAVTGEAISGADGAFAIVGLDGGPHGVRAHAEGYASTTVLAGAGEVDVVITLAAGARIVGKVVDPSGEPVPAPTVVVQQRAGLVARAITVVSVFDAEGGFTVDGLAAGSYEIVAQAAGFAPSAPTAATAVLAGADAIDVVVTLQRGATVIGTIIDGDTKAPLENAKITVEGALGEGSSAVPLVTTAITAADGRFELAGILPGRRSLTAGAYAHHLAIVGPLELADGAREGPVTVELSPTLPGEEPRIELAGVGAKLSAAGDLLRVEGTVPGSGAEAAGIVAGDLILAIDGTPVVELGMDGSIQRIRGPVGSVVTLKVQSVDQTPRDVAVTRTKIRA